MSQTNRWRMHQDNSEAELAKGALPAPAKAANERYYVFIESPDDDEFGVSDSFSNVEDALAWAEDQRNEYVNGSYYDAERDDPIVTIIFGREIKVKRAGYVIEQD